MALILIAEDDPDIRLLIVMILRRSGEHRLIEADNGLDALRLAREQRPDLIVTDHLMPHMTGEMLCRELQSQPTTAGIPVIMISGSLDTADAPRCAYGVVRFLAKPADPRAVLAAVAAALGERSEPTPSIPATRVPRAEPESTRPTR